MIQVHIKAALNAAFFMSMFDQNNALPAYAFLKGVP
jgi:hypothetical protein